MPKFPDPPNRELFSAYQGKLLWHRARPRDEKGGIRPCRLSVAIGERTAWREASLSRNRKFTGREQGLNRSLTGR
jgi:hypothetical protein